MTRRTSRLAERAKSLALRLVPRAAARATVARCWLALRLHAQHAIASRRAAAMHEESEHSEGSVERLLSACI